MLKHSASRIIVFIIGVFAVFVLLYHFFGGGVARQKETTSKGTPVNDSFDLGSITMLNTSKSACFSSMGYDYDKNTLVVTFRDSGSTYAYYDVPVSVWSELVADEALGTYYNKHIKDYYNCEKIE